MSIRRKLLGVVAATAALVLLHAAPAAARPAGSGSIAGQITKHGPGPVTVNLFTTAGAAAGQITSDEDGRYRFAEVPSGEYKLQFGHSGNYQWAHQQLGFSKADVVRVTDGADVVVDDTMLKAGIVEVIATDAASGDLVDTICADVWENSKRYCGGTDGVLRLTDLPEGKHTIHVQSSDGLHANTETADVEVTWGKVTFVEVALEPTAAFTTSVVDRATGEPVNEVCVALLPVVFGGIDNDTCEWTRNHTDEAGKLTLGGLEPGEYTVLAAPHDEVHGLQWVGKAGGVGSQYQAQRVVLSAGKATTLATIKLDPATTITGVIKAAATGEPITYGCARVLPHLRGGFGGGPGTGCSGWGDEGRYTISRLGPYDWPVYFSPDYDDYTPVWSGGASDRKSATLVQARVGAPGTADVALQPTTISLRPRVVDGAGQLYDGALYLTVVNARTGDYVGELEHDRTVMGLGDQVVRLQYRVDDDFKDGWHGGMNFATATNVRAKSDKETKVTITLQSAG
jgi:hypothetical protein